MGYFIIDKCEFSTLVCLMRRQENQISYLSIWLVDDGCEPPVDVAEGSPEGGVHHLGQIDEGHGTVSVLEEN